MPPDDRRSKRRNDRGGQEEILDGEEPGDAKNCRNKWHPQDEEDNAEVTRRDLAPMFQVVAGRETQQVCAPPTINRVEPYAQRANDEDGCEIVEHGLAPNV